MKIIKCQSCSGTWIVKKEDLERQKVCPYCEISVQGKIEFDTYDSLDNAIYGAVTSIGEKVLQNPRQMSGFMLDTAPNLKKEIRIFCKTVTDDYTSYVTSLYEQELYEAETTLRKLRQLFIEEEGLSELWADMICDGLYGALLYYKGIGETQLINVDVDDFESQRINEDSLEILKQDNIRAKSDSLVKQDVETRNVTTPSRIKSSSPQRNLNEDPENRLGKALKYYNGTDGYVKDERKALKLLREQANCNNYIPACNCLGRIFMKRRDYHGAAKWYQKSSKANDTEGLCLMGYFYQKGYGGIQQNTSSAIECLSKASSGGNFDQMISIARKFLKGGEFPKEEKIAVLILEAAGNSGNADAQYYLAKCYQNGNGVSINIGKAIELYKMASKNGQREAKLELIDIQETLSFSERLKYRIKG